MHVASSDNKHMLEIPFTLDSGSAITTINKNFLRLLGYGDSWLKENRSSAGVKLKQADGSPLDVYAVKAVSMTLSGIAIKSGFIYTSDTLNALQTVLGRDMMRCFLWGIDLYGGIILYVFNDNVRKLPEFPGDDYVMGVEV
jgi:hypothetical protein